MPICFSRILLGGDTGPHWASVFVSGSVTDAEAVKQTHVCQEAVRNHPEIRTWPALCVAYVGRGLSSTLEELLQDVDLAAGLPGGNTTLGVVVTNAKLDKTHLAKAAGMTHNGYARAIRPVHTCKTRT